MARTNVRKLEENLEDKRFEGANNWDDVTKLLADMALENSKDSKSMARSVVEQAKNNVRRWFIAWLVTLAALVGTNAAWLYMWQTYEYVSQDGNGINTINTGNQGDVTNEPDGND